MVVELGSLVAYINSVKKFCIDSQGSDDTKCRRNNKFRCLINIQMYVGCSLVWNNMQTSNFPIQPFQSEVLRQQPNIARLMTLDTFLDALASLESVMSEG